MKRVTGIGGIFFKSKNPAKIQQWYQKHLGIGPARSGAIMFEWISKASGKAGCTVWSPFDRKTKYFRPSSKEFMFNYRVRNLPALLKQLRRERVRIVGTMQEYDFGKFGWIMDPEGNKIELWEPVDADRRKRGKRGKR